MHCSGNNVVVVDWNIFVRTVHELIMNQHSPRDMRGKHSNRLMAKSQPLKTLIVYQIDLFKPRQSHYLFRDNQK